MIIDTVTLACCTVLIVLCLGSVFMNPFVRGFRKKQGEDVPETSDKPISVLVLANDNAEALDAHLPILLSQSYEADYEVIVVMKHGDVATECVIKKLSQNKKLRTTFIPEGSLFMSDRKLAVTLGVKAAQYEWVVLLDAESTPLSHRWLAAMAKWCNSENDIVLGYSNFSPTAKASCRFERIRTFHYLARQAVKGCAYRCGGTNLAFRKRMFIDGDGYKGNLQYTNGEYDFIVNKYSRPLRSAVATSKDAIIREDEPSKRTWTTRHLAYLYLRKAMKHGKGLQLLQGVDTLLLWMNYIIIISAIALSSYSQNWIVLAVAAVTLIATLWLRILFAGKALRAFDEQMAKWKIPFLELLLLLRKASFLLRLSRADKRDFSTHKL